MAETYEHQDESHDVAIRKLPEDVLITIPVRGMVLFPGLVLPVAIGRKRSAQAAQEAIRSERPVGLIMQRDPADGDPGPDDLYKIGTICNVLRYVTTPDGTHHLVCQGEQRFRVLDYVEGHPFMLTRFEAIKEDEAIPTEVEARMLTLKQRATEALELLPQTPPELVQAVQSIDSPALLADTITAYMNIKPEEKQEILELVDIDRRLERVGELLDHQLEVLRLSNKINERTKESMNERQREALLREQLRSIQKELGEEDSKAAEIQEIDEAIAKAGMPEEAEKEARNELKRLERIPEAAAEYSMVRTYLDWMTDLPWSKLSEDNIDMGRAREILDADHYGLDKIKRRILEHLAVHKLNPEGKSPILCFVGPPGVGKTSLGQSIAKAMGREFVRGSLGGVHDEAEIRGHRRTYVGALPGTIVQSIRKAGTRNPLFMLDEMDKLGAGFHGDPSSALLEVLDPEQNSTFRDNYLGVDFDLSRVMFVGTANVLDQIPGPLRDRMEVIEVPGYTSEEKVEIAKRYLVRRRLESAGLKPGQCEITDAALQRIVRDYTREAGVRNLEREIGAVVRHVAVQVAENEQTGQHRIDADDLEGILGAPRFESELAMRTSVPGVATGLAWTPVGGDILFIEASRAPGTGKLTLTGQLGDVMKESAQAALSLIKAHADELGIDAGQFSKHDIHIHVPSGAIPKDGPSAGVSIYTALVSLLTGKTVRHDVAMTGEITLRGLVLPIGGIKEKSLAALNAGIKTVLLPARNKKNLEDIPERARKDLKFVWLERVEDATRAALEDESAVAAQA
ncbi:MAG TPA: endopeptidase La [Gammaproteobacteria bacterium]|nr:endopeptidase La [Gammaproteobacteria bacterium]